LTDEYSRQTREIVDAQFGEGYFDNKVIEAEVAGLEASFNPEVSEQLDQSIENTEKLLDALVLRFAAMHVAEHKEDHSYVTYTAATLYELVSNYPDYVQKALLLMALDVLGMIYAHAGIDQDEQ
jgi:hypothetical protein